MPNIGINSTTDWDFSDTVYGGSYTYVSSNTNGDWYNNWYNTGNYRQKDNNMIIKIGDWCFYLNAKKSFAKRIRFKMMEIFTPFKIIEWKSEKNIQVEKMLKKLSEAK